MKKLEKLSVSMSVSRLMTLMECQIMGVMYSVLGPQVNGMM